MTSICQETLPKDFNFSSSLPNSFCSAEILIGRKPKRQPSLGTVSCRVLSGRQIPRMSSSNRSFGNARRGGPEPINPQLPVLDVAPLNSVPYISPTSTSNMDASPQENENGAKAEDGPCLVYLSSPSPKELDDLLSASRSGIAFTGSAAMGQIGPIIGRRDIFEDDDSYLFRVLLTGVANDDFSWNVDPDGKVLIKGVTYTGEKTVVKHSMVFKMLTQNLCPPGHFAVSFQLPGPVDNAQLSGHYDDGIFEAVVKKRKK